MRSVHCKVAVGILIGFAVAGAQAHAQDPTPIVQPTVGRRVIICDQWQWIGNGATTWGCVMQPRAVALAGGQITDQVVASLQSQIEALKAEIEALKASRP